MDDLSLLFFLIFLFGLTLGFAWGYNKGKRNGAAWMAATITKGINKFHASIN